MLAVTMKGDAVVDLFEVPLRPLNLADHHGECFAQLGYERAESVSDRGELDYVTATLSGKFLSNESLGLGISAQYQDNRRGGRSVSLGPVFGAYLPSGVSSISSIDPRIPFPFVGGSDEIIYNSLSATLSEVESETLNLTVSAAFEPHSSTTVRADYTHVDTEAVSVRSNIRFAPRVVYSERPIAELDGELRNAAEWSGSFTVSQQLGIAPRSLDSDTLSLRSNTSLGRWELDLTTGISEAKQDRDGGFSASFRHNNRTPDSSLFLPNAVDPTEGIILSPLSPANGVPLFTDAGVSEYTNPAALNFTRGSFDILQGSDERRHFEADVRYSPAFSLVNYVAAGFDIEDVDIRDFNDTRSISSSASLREMNLPANASVFSLPNDVSGFVIPGAGQAWVLRDFVNSNSGDGGIFSVSDFLRDPLLRQTFTQELNFDYYVETSLQWRDLEIVGGVRVTTTDVDAAVTSSPQILDVGFVPIVEAEERLRGIAQIEGDTRDVLPRLLINYRPTENLVVRAGYHYAVSRPAIFDINGPLIYLVVFDPQFGDGTQKWASFQFPNPDLRPTTSDNFDLGFEYYFQNSGIVKFNLFYKAIENLQETIATGSAELSEIDLPDDPIFDDLIQNPDEWFVEVRVPKNNPSVSTVWGAEFEYERQFTGLPGMFSGLGLFGNVAYTESEKDELASFGGEEITISDVNFFGQPTYSGTVGITYNYDSVDASLSYSFQDDVFMSRRDFGLDQYSESFETLDFRIEYLLERELGQFRIFLEGADILRDGNEPNRVTVLGGENSVPRVLNSRTYFDGRALRLGVVASF